MIVPTKSRFEYKYRMSIATYYRTLNAIRPFCRPDEHSLITESGRYLVRSLYYDCYNYSAYTKKMEGIFHRDKLRIRSYEKNREETSKVKVEVKSRIGYLIYKQSDSIDIADYQTFLNDGNWGTGTGLALDEFSYNYFKFQMKPTVLVEYQREAYFSIADRGLRFSFDHDVRYAWSTDLFAADTELKPCLQNSIIFEIKSDNNDIGWLSAAIQDLGLVSEPNSKYANAFERTANDVWV